VWAVVGYEAWVGCGRSRVTRPGRGVGALGFGSAELRWDVGVCGRVWAPLGVVAEKCRT